MGHKTDPLDFILDPGNSVKRSKDLNKARKLARKVANNSVIDIRFWNVPYKSTNPLRLYFPSTDKLLQTWIWRVATNHSLNCFGTHSYHVLM